MSGIEIAHEQIDENQPIHSFLMVAPDGSALEALLRTAMDWRERIDLKPIGNILSGILDDDAGQADINQNRAQLVERDGGVYEIMVLKPVWWDERVADQIAYGQSVQRAFERTVFNLWNSRKGAYHRMTAYLRWLRDGRSYNWRVL